MFIEELEDDGVDSIFIEMGRTPEYESVTLHRSSKPKEGFPNNVFVSIGHRRWQAA